VGLGRSMGVFGGETVLRDKNKYLERRLGC